VRRYQVFAAGVSVALLLGAATPALAAGKGKANAPGQTKTKPNKPADHPNPPANKPPKPSKNKAGGVSGGGSIGAAEVSIQARTYRLAKGHFNYTVADNPATPLVDETYKLRCRDFSAVGVFAMTAPTATLTGAKCSLTTVVNGVPTTQPVTINATFTDNGQPNSATKDAAFFYLTTDLATKIGGDLTGGNIKVR